MYGITIQNMETPEITREEENALLLQALSGTNDSQSDSNDDESEDTETEETEDVESEENPKEEDKPQATKAQKKWAKILSERNALKKELEELKSRESGSDTYSEEYLNKLIDQRVAEKNEVQGFFQKYPEAEEIRDELKEFMEENPSFSYERAYKLFLAETAPEKLLSPETQNKMNSSKYSTSVGVPVKHESKVTHSSDELSKLIKAGRIKL